MKHFRRQDEAAGPAATMASSHSFMCRARLISPCPFLRAQTLCRLESAAPWPKSLYKLFVHINSWHHLLAPHLVTPPSS